MRLRTALLTALAFGMAGPLATPVPLVAQDDDPLDTEVEGRLLREAAGFEWRGRTDEAEEVLMGLLERWPTSSGGLFSLERVLRSRSRVGLVLPFADAYLDADPTASGVRYMKLRVLVEIDSLSALDEVAQGWFDAEEGPEPYREVARLYGRAFDEAAALEVLEQGRAALPGDDDPLALEIGDLRARLGDAEGAVREWSLAVVRPQVEPGLVIPRVARLRDDDPEGTVVGPLIDVLSAEGASDEMRATAVRVALQLGLETRARTLAEDALPALNLAERIEFLADLAQRADESELPALRLWALREQRERMGERDARALDVRIASAALAVGDTTAALEAQTRLARALPPQSAERRRVIADLIRVEAPRGSVETLRTRLTGFVREFPDAPEVDELTALVAAAMAARGDREAALQVLAGAPGPRSALERAFLHLRDGEIEEGRTALEAALPSLPPSAATEGIQLVAIFDRVTPPSAIALGRTAAAEHWGEPGRAADSLAAFAESAADEDRAPLYAQAARWAEADGDAEAAARWFARIVTSWVDAPEHAEAIYRLARIRADQSGGIAEARALLQQLILDRPNSPVVPAARRELQRIGRGQL